jgi:hypothetical protein
MLSDTEILGYQEFEHISLTYSITDEGRQFLVSRGGRID